MAAFISRLITASQCNLSWLSGNLTVKTRLQEAATTGQEIVPHICIVFTRVPIFSTKLNNSDLLYRLEHDNHWFIQLTTRGQICIFPRTMFPSFWKMLVYSHIIQAKSTDYVTVEFFFFHCKCEVICPWWMFKGSARHWQNLQCNSWVQRSITAPSHITCPHVQLGKIKPVGEWENEPSPVHSSELSD